MHSCVIPRSGPDDSGSARGSYASVNFTVAKQRARKLQRIGGLHLATALLLCFCASASAQRNRSAVELYYQSQPERNTVSPVDAPRTQGPRATPARDQFTVNSADADRGQNPRFNLERDRFTVSPLESDKSQPQRYSLDTSPTARNPATRNTVDPTTLTRSTNNLLTGQRPLAPAQRALPYNAYGNGNYYRPEFERSQFEKPQFDRPKFERAQFERATGERAQMVRAEFLKPQMDKPQFQRPEFEKPQFDQAMQPGSADARSSSRSFFSKCPICGDRPPPRNCCGYCGSPNECQHCARGEHAPGGGPITKETQLRAQKARAVLQEVPASQLLQRPPVEAETYRYFTDPRFRSRQP